MRAMSARPSSTAVERLWNSFGDNLTAKRRSLLNETLQMLVYTKLNHFVLQWDDVDCSKIRDAHYQFQSILEFVDHMIEEELVARECGPQEVLHVDGAVDLGGDSNTESDDIGA